MRMMTLRSSSGCTIVLVHDTRGTVKDQIILGGTHLSRVSPQSTQFGTSTCMIMPENVEKAPIAT